MEKNKLLIIAAGVLIALVIAWYLISPLFIVLETSDEAPLGANETLLKEMSLASGDFVASAHDVEGKAYIIETEEGRILRFENFETVNGPNLHIYLSTDTGVDDYVDLGEIKSTKGDVNYEIPEGVDIEKYDTVLVWCVPFRVLFSYAELS